MEEKQGGLLPRSELLSVKIRELELLRYIILTKAAARFTFKALLVTVFIIH